MSAAWDSKMRFVAVKKRVNSIKCLLDEQEMIYSRFDFSTVLSPLRPWSGAAVAGVQFAKLSNE